MLIGVKIEFVVQGRYGQEWLDLEKPANVVQGLTLLQNLKTSRPDGEFRLVERSIKEELKEKI